MGSFLTGMYQTLQVGEFRRATEQPAHSKVSMDPNAHYDASSGEAISSQPPRSRVPEAADQTYLVANSQWECEACCTGIHPSNPALQSFRMVCPGAMQQDSNVPQKETLWFGASSKLSLGTLPWPHEAPAS